MIAGFSDAAGANAIAPTALRRPEHYFLTGAAA